VTVRTAAAALAGLAGVLVIEGPAAASALRGGSDAGPIWIGGLLIIASSVVSAYSNVYVKKRLGRVSPVVNVWGQTLVGSLVLFAAALAFEPGRAARWTATSIGALLYLAIAGTVLTFVALYWLVPRVPMSVIGTIPLVDTVIAVILGAVFLGEALPLRVFAGGLLIVAGVLLATSSGPAPARPVRGTV
jgi:drug/metabolite transporter (DMT)-like permease